MVADFFTVKSVGAEPVKKCDIVQKLDDNILKFLFLWRYVNSPRLLLLCLDALYSYIEFVILDIG